MVRKRIKEVISHCQLVITHSFWMNIHKLCTKVLGNFLKSYNSHLPFNDKQLQICLLLKGCSSLKLINVCIIKQKYMIA